MCKPVLEQIRLLQVTWILASDWIKLRESHAIPGICVIFAKQVYLGPVKRVTCKDSMQKVELLSIFCCNFSQPATIWFVAKQIRFEVGRTCNIAIQLVLHHVAKQVTRFRVSFQLPYLTSRAISSVILLLLKISKTKLIFFYTGAEKFCPQRYSTMMRWIEIARGTLTLIKTKILKLFHFTGEKRSIPTCPAEPDVNFSPSLGVAVHTPSPSNCRFTARYKLPFFVDKMGSEFMEWTTAVHESVPGHHLQDASYREIFKPK